jgi:hypothetical protein
MKHITLNQGLRRIEVSDLEIENDLAFEHFDRLPADQRDAEFIKAFCPSSEHLALMAA